MDAEVGRELELVDDIEPGNVGQIPPDLPNKGQIRGVREKERKQSHITQFFSGGNSSKGTTKQASEATTKKKRIASGDLRQKASKTQIAPSKNLHESANKRSNQLGRLTLQDQAQIGAENKAGDRPRAAAAPPQRIRTSGIPEAIRIMIARKREEAIKKKKDREEGEQVKRILAGTEEDRSILEDQAQIEEENHAAREAIKKKNDREEGEQVEHESHKKQKSKQSDNLKKRQFEYVEEEDVSSSSKRQKGNGKKRDKTHVEDAEQENSNKRGKSAGQNGFKQLGCSTHKGIS